VLARRDRALADAERVWDGLDPFLHEGLQPPGELLEETGCVQDPPLFTAAFPSQDRMEPRRQKGVASGSARC
jgi:hypothetical protein